MCNLIKAGNTTGYEELVLSWNLNKSMIQFYTYNTQLWAKIMTSRQLLRQPHLLNNVTSDTKSIYENKLLEHYRNSTQIPSINKLIIAYLLTKKVEVIGGDGNLLTVEETEGNLDLVDNIIAKRIQELTYYYRINLGYCNDSEFMKIFS
ncbi:uncharacterized protein LOC135926605 isoform X3 [Gordionus sp. m RMFG-2023]|uniref:uncharacterized protein LOC135926605 isoform X3 n=1 Tax=Gordionus sp. m RMFG-2023 TaxID=3053472 RepID=UPI0031FDB6AE